MKNFNLSIVTPEGPLFEGQCHQVEVPGSEGVFGVLANHMNLIAELKPGLVKIHSTDGEEGFVVAEGIAEVDSKHCVLLVEKASSLVNINIRDIQAKLEKVRHELLKVDSTTLYASLLAESQFLASILENCNDRV